MKIGLQMYHFDWSGTPGNTGTRLAEIARTAEKAGFSSFWIMDHLFQLGEPFGPVDAPLLDSYTALSYVAAVTNRIKLGVLVTNNILRHPGVLIKMVSSLDVLSGGRMYLGIGPGGMVEREIKGLGIPRPSLSERISRLEETLMIFKHLWSRNRTPFHGRYFQLEEPICEPQPLSKPHPPILIGMWRGGPRMLRLTARYADACNFQFGTALDEWPDWLRAKYEERRKFIPDRLGKLRRLCEEEGRAFDEIEKTILGKIKLAPDAMSVEDVIVLCVEMRELGIEHVIFNMPNSHEIKPIEIIGEEVIPQVSELEACEK